MYKVDIYKSFIQSCFETCFDLVKHFLFYLLWNKCWLASWSIRNIQPYYNSFFYFNLAVQDFNAKSKTHKLICWWLKTVQLRRSCVLFRLFRPEIVYDNFATYFDQLTIYYNVWLKNKLFLAFYTNKNLNGSRFEHTTFGLLFVKIPSF